LGTTAKKKPAKNNLQAVKIIYITKQGFVTRIIFIFYFNPNIEADASAKRTNGVKYNPKNIVGMANNKSIT